jgi:hypothetical protein
MVKIIHTHVYKHSYVRQINMLMINIMTEFVYYNVLIRILIIVSLKCLLTLYLKCAFINVQTIISATLYKITVHERFVLAHVRLL